MMSVNVVHSNVQYSSGLM